MKMLQLRCPNCGAMLDLKDDIGTQCFCNYCGTKILLDEQQDSVINAKVRIKELEHEKYKIDKEYEEQRRSDHQIVFCLLIMMGIGLLCMFLSGIIGNGIS